MRKKLSSILIGILLIFTGVFISACGNKYKDFEFKITYAFSEDAEKWYDANNGISLNYMVEGDEYVFNIQDNEERVNKNDFNIYIKVEVENVKAKYLDSITISAEGSSGLSFTSSTIKNGKAVKLPIVGLVNSRISFYENKSGKSTKIDLSVYGKLTNITRNENITPAIVVGNSIDLNSIRDLVYYNKNGVTTNQTGVNYEIVEFGSFGAAGVFVPDSVSNNQLNKQFIKLNHSIITFETEEDFDLTMSNNVLKIKAISKFSPAEPTADNPEIADYIYVYIVENDLSAPLVTFAATDVDVNKHVDSNGQPTNNSGIDVYFNSSRDESLNVYTNSQVKVSNADSIYTDGVKTADGRTLKYNVVAYIGNSNNAYEFNSAEPIKNLRIEKNGEIYTITQLSQSVEKQTNVRFAYELVCVEGENEYPVTFTEAKPTLQTDVVVRKHTLTSSILINGQNYEDGDTINGVVYSTSNVGDTSYGAYNLQVGVEPLDQHNPQKTKIEYSESALHITDLNGFKVKTGEEVSQNKTLKIKFVNSVYSDQVVTISTYKTPSYHNGENVASRDSIEVTLTLKRKVTADALEFVEPIDATNFKNVSSLNVATTKESYIYLKAYHKSNLDIETITLVSGNFALNASGDKQILLNASNVITDATWNSAEYSIYKIAIPATNSLSTSKLTAYAGELGIGAKSEIELKSVDLITNASNIKIIAKDNDYITSFANNKFAIANNQDVSFNVVEQIGGENIHNTIQSIGIVDVNITDASIKDKFGKEDVLRATPFANSNILNIYGWNAKTRVLNILVNYYAQDITTGVISLQTTTLENVQFAIYNPITSIDVSVSKPYIAYVNSLFNMDAEEAVEIEYTSYSSYGSISDIVYFINGDGSLDDKTGLGATSVNVYVDKELSERQEVKISYLNGNNYTQLPNTNKLLLNHAKNNGKLKLQLTGSVENLLSNLNFIAVANRFINSTATQKSGIVNFAKVERAKGFNIYGDEDSLIVEYSEENKELQISFMGVADDVVLKEFTATPVYENVIPAANTLQFKDLEKFVYKYVYNNKGEMQLVPISDFEDSLKVSINGDKIIVSADKTYPNIGGLYKLVIATKDSFSDSTRQYENTCSINVRVSDGSTLDAAYIITKPEQFKDINNDLDAYYVLGNNISVNLDKPIGFAGSNVVPFTGNLSGKLETYTENNVLNTLNYSLNVTLNGTMESNSYGYMFGIFTILGENGKISNLDINIKFSSSITTKGKSTIGGIAAVNEGVIENVKVNLTGNVTLNNTIKNVETNFGGIVGVNNSTGKIQDCVIDSSGRIVITANAKTNIGGVVGLNNGLIKGKYTGQKEDLNKIKYDVIANLTINNTEDEIEYNIGAVAGYSSAEISNLLVGGRVIVNSKVPNVTPAQLLEIKRFFGGIVGNSSADIKNVAAVGLDLICQEVDADSGILVAGIAGSAANIADARFISLLAKHSFGQTLGQIRGKVVAGIAHTATSVTYSTIESFIETLTDKDTGEKTTFYTLEGETAYGLINTGSVSNSFVSANIKATNVYLTSNSTESTTYFIGKVGKIDPLATQNITKNSTYSVVITDDNKNATLSFAKQLFEFASFDKDKWKTNITITGSEFTIDEETNILKFSDYANIDFFFPYIEKGGKPLMILQPSSISAAINKDYQIEAEKNVYVNGLNIKDDKTPPTYTITESIVVDYFENKYSNYENLDVNKHILVNRLCDNCKNDLGECLDEEYCDNGLIDLSVFPPNSTTGLSFELIDNYVDIAEIINNEYILFTGVTNGKPVIIRAYSMFNQEAEAYFAIYAQPTFTKLLLDGANVEIGSSSEDYILNIYEGKNTLFSVGAENIKGGTSFDSIFAKNNPYIKLEIEGNQTFTNEETGKVENKLIINTTNLKSISMFINENYSLTKKNEDIQQLTFNVYLDKAYFGAFRNEDLLLGSINVTARLTTAATQLDIVGSDDFEIDTSSTLNFTASLTTGFADKNDIENEERELSTEVIDGVVVVNKANTDENGKKDSIRLSISSTSAELDRIKTLTHSNSYADLFNYEVFETKTADGYKYDVSLYLKDKFNYRYITSNINLFINIWAYSDNSINNSVKVVIKPTTANTTRLANYAVESVKTISSTKSELTIENIETSIISPGGRGNIMLAYIEKSYANIDSISITSSDLYVPEKGRNVNLVFTQYVYNTDTHKFETLFNSGVQAQNGNTLVLQKATTINNAGVTEYTGLLYIHVQLIKFSGLEARITASLNVTSNGKTLPVVTKDLSTTFLPGASISYVGKEIKDGYLIQEDTYANSAKIRLYGYQFNSNPTIISNWELVDGVDYFYHIDGTNNKEIDLTDKTEEEKTTILNEDKLYYYLASDIEDTDGKITQAKGYYKATSEDLSRTGITFYSISNKKVIWIDKENIGAVDSNELHHVADYVSTYIVKDYKEVDYNSVDGSYTMEVKFNVAKNIPTTFSLQAGLSLITKEGQLVEERSDKINFYPTEYIVTGVAVKNTPGNRKMLAINRTDKFELIFSTNRTDYDYSQSIYENNFLSDIENLKELFSYYNPTEKTFADTSSEFDVAVRNDYLNVIGLSKFEKEITLKIWVGYDFENGKHQIRFSERAQDGLQLLEYKFLLQIYPGAGEENATPIYYAHEMFGEDGTCKLAENAHYILMNDITLDLVKPIDYAIGSLDGNNHIIKIKNFVIDKSNTEYGLFANIGTYQDEEQRSHKTILKNVIVDYSEFNAANSGKLEFTNNQMTTIKFGGLVATNNGGLIYNCDVINSNPAMDKNINIITDANANVTFGGLVGENKGIITNSRVGRREFNDIDAIADSYVKQTFGGLTFTLGSSTASGFNVVAGGFVGVNSGTISSSYFANSNLINYSNSKDLNITAGFAGQNTSGTIVYSYVKAKETTITSSSPYATGAMIKNTSNGILAGFVYENSGTIKDCYANTELQTDSTYVAGFVYRNASSGSISECYAACKMNNDENQDNAEQPFLGKDEKDNYLNAGTMKNNYYLITGSGSGDVNATFAQALNATNFSIANNLQGFVFVQSNVIAERQQGVWSHIDHNNNSVILPELMNANLIAHSAKYLYSGNGIEEKFVYTNADSYMEGSANNPYIIRNVQEFNNILTGDRADMSTEISKSGYIRLIDNIDFAEDQDAIKTRVKYSLGDKNRSNITSFEGNGLSISGIYFDVSEPGIREIGLFATINYAYVKNLNLNFVTPKTGGQYSTTLVKYSGGLAGTISNSAIINVNLNGSDVALTGENYVGGVAGLITGDSLLYGITSNLSVVASSPNTGLYYNKADFVTMGNNENSYNSYISQLSYAGGVAGVIDINKRANTEYNIAYIDIHGDEMFVKTSDNSVQLPNISAQYAGGVAGFASKNASALKLKYHVGSSDWISGSIAAGGLFGVSLGNITASQVTAVEEKQFGYDTELGKYILDIDNQDLSKLKVGNKKLIESNNYAGGLIGIGLNAGINASYSKAGIRNAKVIGGLIGASIASSVTYSYAVPFVNINEGAQIQAGGLFGFATSIEKDTNYVGDDIETYKKLVQMYLNKNNVTSRITYTDIQYTFSTLLLDKNQLKENYNNSTMKLDYLLPNSTTNSVVSNLKCGGNSLFTNVFVGRPMIVDADSYIFNNGELVTPVSTNESFNIRSLNELYDLTHVKHETTFNEIFSSWKTITYWSIKHEKYFPLLTNDGVENYIIISNADEFKQISSNLDGKYLVVNDIDIGNIAGNWVIPGRFTGELIGQIDPDSKTRKRIYNISLAPNSEDSTGFFQETKGAIISDLEFVWNDNGDGGAINSGVDKLKDVSGLSCLDSPFEDGENTQFSEFNNIEVSVSGGGYLIEQQDSRTITINKFGGLVAQTSSSTIINCDFVGKVETKLSATSDTTTAHFGGLVGYAKKATGNDETIQNSSMSIMNSQIGADGEDLNKVITKFDIEISSGCQAKIGGLVGEIENGSILGGRVGDVNILNVNYKTIEINITSSSSQQTGGLVGVALNSAISSSDADVAITIDGENTSSTEVGGLVANYSETTGKVNITNSNAKANIDVSKLTTNTIFISGGVATLSATKEAIKQCLFVGKIEAEETEISGVAVTSAAPTTLSKLSANTIVAGGAVASLSGNATISETMSTVDITIGAENATELKAGGFVGSVEASANLALNNVVSSGKLVPFCGNNATAVHLGGMIGSVDDNSRASITKSYTVTSIISDAISGKALEKTHSDALVGYAKKTIDVETGIIIYNVTATNVYFSTDFALTTNDNNLGKNISAYDFVYDDKDVWINSFVSAQANKWKKLENAESGTGKLPYLKALEDNLAKYQVLISDGDNYDYVSGSSLRPKQSVSTFENEFTYYILNEVSETISGTLKGVLIGKELEFCVAKITDGVVAAEDDSIIQAGALIKEISTHSAVSNVHLTMGENKSYAIDGTVGLIANTNNGLIFNSSVQGKQITISGGTSLGLITAVNNGTVAYSYSSAEIIRVDCDMSGIVDTNAGAINTCYFTGYINNTKNAAGIVRATNGTNSYVYNSYMAGVVEKITERGTSLYAGEVSSTNFDGKNNYIDKFANVELTLNNVNDTILKSVATAELMARFDLLGAWYDSVTSESSKDNVKIDTTSAETSFGKNYGYPIYRFNKICSNAAGDSVECVDLYYSLETGTGKTEQTTVSNMYTKLTSNEPTDATEYNNSYKIPHLGVLTAVHGLQDKLRNYVVIHDITGRELRKIPDSNNPVNMIYWTGIGSTTDAVQGFAHTGAFNGVFITNKYLNNSTSVDGKTKELCTIQGLDNNGLFNEIGASYIADIKLGSFGDIENGSGLQESGPIGNIVTSETAINNISYIDESVVEGTKVGGLFGSVESNVTIKNFSTAKDSLPAVIFKGKNINTDIAGTIAYQLISGTINLDTAPEVAVASAGSETTNTIVPHFENFATIGGLIGEYIAGTINGNGNTITLAKLTTELYVGTFGGIIGKTISETVAPASASESATSANIDNIIVAIPDINAVIRTNIFGGFVGVANNTISFTKCLLNTPKVKIISNDSGARGLLIGEIANEAEVSVNFGMKLAVELEFVGDNNSSSSIGGFVGKQNGDLNTTIAEGSALKTIKLITSETPNMGGIVGLYEDGEINFNNSIALKTITLQGKQNVGGFIGYANKFPTIKDGSLNFLNTSAYAEIVITENAESNFGGIFGLLKDSNKNSDATGDEVVTSSADSYYEIINNNKVTINIDAAKAAAKDNFTISNIGGVIGEVAPKTEESGNKNYATLGELINNSSIDLSTAQNVKLTNIGGIIGKFDGTTIQTATNSGAIKTDGVADHAISNAASTDVENIYAVLMNVGGIIGKIESTNTTEGFKIELNNLSNTTKIQGYQNVGGLIGYAEKVNLIGAISSGEIFGVIDVGGAVGYATESTISNTTTEANVYGNANVGGLIGYSLNNILNSNIVGDDTTDPANQKFIKGVYYNNYYKTKVNNEEKVEYVSYIPTSVGGLIGGSENTEINGNTVKNIQITTTNEGEETGEPNSESKGMISTIKNFMANVSVGTGSSDNLKPNNLYVLGGNANKKIIDFQKIESGFGGFIGTLDKTDDIASASSSTPNEIIGITIYAPLGINVGTYYGVYNHDNANFKVPALSGKVKVDGAYHVGGVAGRVNGDISDFDNSNLIAITTSDSEVGATSATETKISVQPTLSGMYVGGLFGVVKAQNVSGLEIVNSNINITITTNSSYYIGGLVGKLVVENPGNTFIGAVEGLTINGNDAQNFGGLVGMLKCVGNSSGTYSVKGIHSSPFTVNTIENQNYADGKSYFDSNLNEEDNTLELIAQANYINLDSFDISATSNEKYFDKEKNGGTEPCNPLLSSKDSWGWAKEYTGFKQMQRCIPAKKNNGAEWDSIGVVYNAEWITRVGTVKNLDLASGTYCNKSCTNSEDGHSHSTIRKEDDGKLYYTKSAQFFELDNQHIVYTIYKKNMDTEMLYTSIGVAELAKVGDSNVTKGSEDVEFSYKKSEKGETLKETLSANSTNWYVYGMDDEHDKWEYLGFEDDVNTIAEYYYMRNIDENQELFGYIKDEKGAKYYPFAYGTTSSEEHENKTSIRGFTQLKTQDLFYFDWSNNTDYVYQCTITDGGDPHKHKEQVKLHYIKLGDKYYDFKIIYANATTTANRSFSDNDVPESGSVFEIYGINPELYSYEWTNGPTVWEKHGWWITIAIEAALAFATWGLSKWISTAWKAGKMFKLWYTIERMKEFITKHKKLLAFLNMIKIIGKPLALAANFTWIGAMALASINSAAVTTRYTYYEIKDQNLGLLTSTNYTSVVYQNNTLINTSVNMALTKIDNGEEYTYYYYSNNRPSDYYKNHYIIPKGETGTEIAEDDGLNLEIAESVSLNNSSIKLKDGYSMTYDYTYTYTDDDGNVQTGTVDAQLKYIYHEGVYYYNSNSAKLESYRTQELSDPSVVAKTEAQAIYDENGIAYVLGEYSDGNYTFDDFDDLNLVHYNESTKKYSLNGNEDLNGEKEVPIDFIGVGTSYTAERKEILGYDYLQNAYYTTNGTPTDNASYTKYATFNYHTGEIGTGWTEGVDYIKATYTLVKDVVNVTNGATHYFDGGTYEQLQDTNEDGVIDNKDENYNITKYKLTPQTAIFTISSMSDSGTETGKNLGYKTEVLKTGDKITLKAYPTCFKDPYTKITADNSFKDGNFYIAKITNSETSGPVFKFPVTYYYFEGGYMSWQELTGSTDTKNDLYNSIYTQINTTDEDYLKNSYTVIYNEEGKDITLTLADLIKDIKGETSNGYANYYISPINGYKDSDTTYKEDEEAAIDGLINLQKVSSNYIKDSGGNIWRRHQQYMLDKDGYVNRLYQTNPVANSQSYFFNKYLTYHIHNGYKGVYTMFKYTDERGDTMDLYFNATEESVWRNSDNNKNYYLIPTALNRSRPNSSAANTVLIESCNVILGGNVTLNHTKTGNSPKSGSITIS